MEDSRNQSQALSKTKKPNKTVKFGNIAVLFIFLFPGLMAISAPKTKICHFTGRKNNPYNSISVPVGDVASTHGNHPKDIIPAPKSGCPSTVDNPPKSTPTVVFVDTATPFAVDTATPFAVNTATPFAVDTATPFAVDTATPFAVDTATPNPPDVPVDTSTPISEDRPYDQPNITSVATYPGINPSGTPENPSVHLTPTATIASPIQSASPTHLPTVTPQVIPTPNNPKPTVYSNIYTWCCTQRERLPLSVSILLAAVAGILICLIVAVLSRFRQHTYL